MFVPLATITVDPIPQHEMGYATSLIAFARNLGAGFGISIFTSFIDRRTQFHQARLMGTMSHRRLEFSQMCSALHGLFVEHGNASVHAAKQAPGSIYDQALQQASVMSYLDGFPILAALLVIATPLIWMKKPHFKKPGGAE